MAYFARAVHFHPLSRSIVNGEENPFPAIGDAAYRKRVGGGPTTDVGNKHKTLVKIARVVPEIYALSMSIGKKTPSRR